MAAISVKEVMTEFNQRSVSGRVVVNPPSRMPPLAMHSRGTLIMCCGRAFLSEESYFRHKASKPNHGKPLDQAQMRLAQGNSPPIVPAPPPLPPRPRTSTTISPAQIQPVVPSSSSLSPVHRAQPGTIISSRDSNAFWRSRKENPPPERIQKYTKMEQMANEEEDNSESSTVEYEKVKCALCGLMICKLKLNNHLKVAHDPNNTARCNFCSCKFFTQRGAHHHESIHHKELKAAQAAHLELLKITSPNKPPAPLQGEVKVKSENSTTPNAKPFAYQQQQQQQQRPFIQSKTTPGASPASKSKKIQKFGGIVHNPAIKKTKLPLKSIKCVAIYVYDNGMKRIHYQCKVCGKVTSRHNMRDHLAVHSGGRDYQCQYCTSRFRFKANCTRHVKCCHTGVAIYKCPVCEGPFTQTYGYITHLKTHNANLKPEPLEEPYEIEQRESTFSNMVIPPFASLVDGPLKPLNSSVQIMAEEKEEKELPPPPLPELKGREKMCEVCHKVLNGAQSLRNHMRVHAERNLECDLCGAKFRQPSVLYGHKKASHLHDGQYFCDMCSCHFRDAIGLNFHRHKFHGNQTLEEQWFNKRAKASAGFGTAMTLKKKARLAFLKPQGGYLPSGKRVKKNHGEGLTNSFYNGGPTSHWQAQLIGQQQQEESPQSRIPLNKTGKISSLEKKYQCSLCNAAYVCEGSIARHLKAAHGDGEFHCSLCSVRCVSMHALGMHYITLHGKPAGMSIKNFEKYLLTSKKPGSMVKKKSPLKSHRALEKRGSPVGIPKPIGYGKSVKTIQCPHCPCLLSNPHYMRRHLQKAHVPDGPLECPHCPCRFAQSSAKVRHIQCYHMVQNRTNPHWKPQSEGLSSIKMEPMSILKKQLTTPTKVVKVEAAESTTPSQYPPPRHSGPRYIKTEQRKFGCDHCGAYFTSQGHLSDHVERNHDPTQPFKCYVCTCTFVSDLGRKIHHRLYHTEAAIMPKKVTKKRPLKSPELKRKQLPTKTKLVTPLKLKLNGKSAIAVKEEPSFNPRPKRSIERKRYDLIENENEELFDMNDGLIDPPTLTPAGKIKRRPVCNNVNSSSPQDLVGIPKLSPNGLICNECNQTCDNEAALAEHLKTHAVVCDMCSSKFRTLSQLKFHNKIAHAPNGQFQCQHCCCRFANETAFRRHTAINHRVEIANEVIIGNDAAAHDDEANNKIMRVPFNPIGIKDEGVYSNNENSTNIESKSPPQESVNIIDSTVTIDDDGYENSESGVTTNGINNEADMKIIMAEPGEEIVMKPSKMQQCNVCQKMVSNLEVHSRIHSGMTPEMCSICSVSFKFRIQLVRHMKNNHQNGTFACAYCPCRLETEGKLRDHFVKYHKDPEAEPIEISS